MTGRIPELILNGHLLSYADGGVQRHVRIMLGALARHHGLEWRVAVPADAKELLEFVPPEHRLTLPAMRARGFVLKEISWNQQLSSWMRRHCPDAVLHNLFHFWAPRPPRYHVLTVHDCLEARFAQRVGSGWVRLYQKLAWRLSRRARAVIAVSDFTRRDVSAYGLVPAEKFVTIHGWLEPSWERPPSAEDIARVRACHQLPLRYAVYVGGYRWHKNVETLLEAWALGRGGEGWLPLVLAGAREKRISLARLATGDSVGDGGVLQTGFVPEEDLPGLYAGAALFVSASLHEGFGYPAVEATACGTPVLVGDSSAMRETVPAAHMRFDPKNPRAIAEHVRSLLANPAAFRRPLDPRFTEKFGFARYRRLIEHVLRMRHNRSDRPAESFEREER